MANYLIHAVPSRMWYVNQYLIPSMMDQGIDRANIAVYTDEKHEGNLKAFIRSAECLKDDTGGTWHMQDDVIISHDFAEVTDKFDDGIVCGFKSEYDGKTQAGLVGVKQMWFSFPCIRIPNKLFKDCIQWIESQMIGNPVYRTYWEGGVNDDWCFRQYVFQNYRNTAINLNPNIVDHIDYLIGGTVNSNKRGRKIRSLLWQDEYLVNELEKKLSAAIL